MTTIVMVTALTALALCLILIFLMYDRHMQGTNHKIIHKAAKSTEFVSSMFPANMHQRLFDSSLAYLHSEEVLNDPGEGDDANAAENGSLVPPQGTESSLTRRDRDNHQDFGALLKSKPIAELYPETTIMVRSRST
jgi:hypothetical protein